MTAVMIELSAESVEAIRRHADAPARMLRGASVGLSRALVETSNHLIRAYLSGTYRPGERRGGSLPLASRSRALRNSADAQMTEELAGVVGSLHGPATRYAAVQLGNDTWTITPKSGRLLTIPIGKNLNPSGVARFDSPRDAAAQYGEDGAWIESDKGSIVYFQPTGGTYQRKTGKAEKGDPKGDILFVGVPSVTIQGSGALPKAVDDRLEDTKDLILQGAIKGWGSEGGDA